MPGLPRQITIGGGTHAAGSGKGCGRPRVPQGGRAGGMDVLRVRECQHIPGPGNHCPGVRNSSLALTRPRVREAVSAPVRPVDEWHRIVRCIPPSLHMPTRERRLRPPEAGGAPHSRRAKRWGQWAMPSTAACLLALASGSALLPRWFSDVGVSLRREADPTGSPELEGGGHEAQHLFDRDGSPIVPLGHGSGTCLCKSCLLVPSPGTMAGCTGDPRRAQDSGSGNRKTSPDPWITDHEPIESAGSHGP